VRERERQRERERARERDGRGHRWGLTHIENMEVQGALYQGGLELRTVKSLKVSMAARHPGGWEGFKADAVREVDAMLHLVGVPGVATCYDLIINEDEGIQIVMEYNFSSPHARNAYLPLSLVSGKIVLVLFRLAGRVRINTPLNALYVVWEELGGLVNKRSSAGS
jgi:hypothetical protein